MIFPGCAGLEKTLHPLGGSLSIQDRASEAKEAVRSQRWDGRAVKPDSPWKFIPGGKVMHENVTLANSSSSVPRRKPGASFWTLKYVC